MECKNCAVSLRTDYSYCPACGAKVIRNRITAKSLFYDFTERFFNLDNTFLTTFRDMFRRPEIVIDGYIKGVRKKYLNPISYITIALTVTGIMVFFIKKSFPEGMDFDLFNTGVYSKESSKKLTNFMTTYYTFLFLLYIPILASCSWLSFRHKKYNFTENVVYLFIPRLTIALLQVV